MERVAERPVLSLADLEGFDPDAPARGHERRFCCPLPGCADKRRDGRHRSLAVNVDTGQWHCHRCDASGLLREHWPHREPRFNARRASSRRAFALNEQPVPAVANLARPEPLPDRSVVGERWRLVFQRAPQVNTDPGAVYLRSRGIPLEVAQTCGARYLAAWPHWEVEPSGNWVLRATSRRVVFPVLDLAGQLTAIQGRVIASAEYGPKVLTRGDLSAGVFQTSQDALAGSFVVIVEAPIDALSLAAAGMQSVALCGTTLPSWLPPALAFRRIALAFDADSAGDSATAKAASELRAFGCEVERWRPSVKDWNEVLLTHGPDTLRRALLADLSRRPSDDAPRTRD